MSEDGRLVAFCGDADPYLVRGVVMVRAERTEPHDAVGGSGGFRVPKGLSGIPCPTKALCHKERVAEGSSRGFRRG